MNTSIASLLFPQCWIHAFTWTYKRFPMKGKGRKTSQTFRQLWPGLLVGVVLTVFAAVLAFKKCFWRYISTVELFYKEIEAIWTSRFKTRAKIEIKEQFSQYISRLRRLVAGYVNCLSEVHVSSAQRRVLILTFTTLLFPDIYLLIKSCYTQANPQWISSFPADGSNTGSIGRSSEYFPGVAFLFLSIEWRKWCKICFETLSLRIK